jgi:hypothetical protein
VVRSDDSTRLHHRVGAQELLAPDESWEEGALRRVEEHAHGRLEEGHSVQQPHVIGGADQHEAENQQPARNVRGDHHLPSIPSIHVDAGEHSEQELREGNGDRGPRHGSD